MCLALDGVQSFFSIVNNHVSPTKVISFKSPHEHNPVQPKKQQQSKDKRHERPEDSTKYASNSIVEEENECKPIEQSSVKWIQY